MTTYKVVVFDSSSGAPKVELPFGNLTFSRVLSGCGQLSCAIPIDCAQATQDNLGTNRTSSDREITVFRDDTAIWNGPITGVVASVSGRTVDITAREASWHFTKRTLEVDKNYNGTDLQTIVDDVKSYMTTKTATGSDGMTAGSSIIATLPRFSQTSSPLSGHTFTSNYTPTFYGAARHTWQQLLDALAADPQTGFEWRMDYHTGSTRLSVSRTLVFGYPSLGSTLTHEMTERVLQDWDRTCDWETAGTRIHVIGSGYTKTLQSATAVGNTILLSEYVDDQTNITNHDLVDARAKDLRRLRQPPTRVFGCSFIPSTSLPYGFCDLGDTIPFNINWPPILSVTGNSRRVVEIDVTAGNGQELVTLVFNDPLSDLGT